MLKVGLTGGIATGKSTVAAVFAGLGAGFIDADIIAHGLQRPDTLVWREIVKTFGDLILRSDRTIDRGWLGRIVFSDAAKRADLEQIMHPAILAKEEELMAEWERSGKVKVGVVEEALMIETGSFRRFHRVVLVAASQEAQIERLRRKGLTQEEALSRIRSQVPLSEKAKYADYLIDNSKDRSEAEREAKRIFQDLLQEAEGTMI